MSKSITKMNNAELVTTTSPARIAEAESRLEKWAMSPKNVRRLEAYVAAAKATAKAEPAVKAARPTGPGSRGGCPVKAACAAYADTQADKSADFGAWMTAYKVATATMRFAQAGGDLTA